MTARTFSLAIVLLVAALASACGEDETSASKTSSSSDASSETKDAGGDDGGGGDSSLVSELLKKRDGASFLVTYKLSGMGTDSSGDMQGGDTTMTMASDGTRSMVQVGEAKIYELADGTSVMCTTDDQCLKLGSDEAGAGAIRASLDQMMQSAEAAGTDSANAKQIDDREIAGRDATCFEYEWDWMGSSATATSCFDKELGVPLLTQWGAETAEGAGSFSSEATELREATDADFTPPSEPRDLGAEINEAAAAGGMSEADIAKLQEQMAGAGAGAAPGADG